MPIINGRYYMNPAYGAALERARQRDEDILKPIVESLESGSIQPMLDFWESDHFSEPSELSGSSPQSPAGKDPQIELLAAQSVPQKQERHNSARNAQEHKAQVGYGETAGLLPKKSPDAPPKAHPYDRRTWDQNSVNELQEARTHIMDISQRNPNVHRARPGSDTISQTIWNDNIHAAATSAGSLPGKHFFIRQEGIGPQRPSKRQGWGQGTPIRSYGPFRNVGGGDVPRGDRTFIDIYNH